MNSMDKLIHLISRALFSFLSLAVHHAASNGKLRVEAIN